MSVKVSATLLLLDCILVAYCKSCHASILLSSSKWSGSRSQNLHALAIVNERLCACIDDFTHWGLSLSLEQYPGK